MPSILESMAKGIHETYALNSDDFYILRFEILYRSIPHVGSNLGLVGWSETSESVTLFLQSLLCQSESRKKFFLSYALAEQVKITEESYFASPYIFQNNHPCRETRLRKDSSFWDHVFRFKNSKPLLNVDPVSPSRSPTKGGILVELLILGIEGLEKTSSGSPINQLIWLAMSIKDREN